MTEIEIMSDSESDMEEKMKGNRITIVPNMLARDPKYIW